MMLPIGNQWRSTSSPASRHNKITLTVSTAPDINELAKAGLTRAISEEVLPFANASESLI